MVLVRTVRSTAGMLLFVSRGKGSSDKHPQHSTMHSVQVQLKRGRELGGHDQKN